MSDVEKAINQLVAYLGGLDPRGLYALVGIGVFLVLVAIIVGLRRRGGVEPKVDPKLEAYEQAMPQPTPPVSAPPEAPAVRLTLAQRQIAEMVETSSLSGLGGFCIFLMLITWGISAVVFVSAKSVMQEIVAVLIWIGGNTMFGVGAIVNRDRTYRIYKP
jgi:hypothetical protein